MPHTPCPLHSGYLVSLGIHALQISVVVSPLCLISIILTGTGTGGRSDEEAAAGADGCAGPRITRCSAEGRADTRADHRSDNGP